MTSMLTPILALVVWTLIVWVWMYATRIPAMQKAGIKPQDAAGGGSLKEKLPANVTSIADNYNHLHEQPTIFYALMAYSHLAGVADGLNIALAWGYVAVRVAHSLVQCTVNIVTVRFALFSLGSLILMAIAVRNVIALLV